MQGTDSILIRVLPKHAISPPPVHRIRLAPSTDAAVVWEGKSEDDRLRALLAPAAPRSRWEEIPEELVGDTPALGCVCPNCKRRGHDLAHCPWKGGGMQQTQQQRQAQRAPPRPTGIPRSQLREVNPEQQDSGQVYVEPSSGRVFSSNFALS